MANASSSSSSSRGQGNPSFIVRLSDEIYELHRPTQGHPKLEIVCCHGFQKEDYDQDAYLRTWMTADGSECWLMTWLPQALPPCRILSVSYDSCVHISSSRGRMDLYLLGENLAYALIMLANVGQSCPVLLVGHCVGGLVLKQVCIQAQRLGIQFRGPGVNPHSTFLNHMKGIFFYATPHLGSKTVEKLTQRSPLVEYLIVYCKETARINQEFSELRQRHRWVAVGVSEGAETVDCNTIVPGSQRDIFAQFGLGERSNATSTLIVEEASARFESEEFSILPEEDHFSICRQKSKQSNSFLRLLTLVDQVMQSEEIGEQIFYRTLRYTTKSFVDMSGRVENIIRNLKLDQASSSSSSGSSSTQLALVGMSGIGKTTLAKEVFISIKSRFDFICFIEDVSDKLKSRELSELMAMHLFHGNGRTPYLQGGCSAAAHSIWYLLKGRKVLLILDGVEDMKKIDPLLALDWCSDGSRLIITTCIHSPELIQSHFLIHNVSLLSKVEARRLFRMCLQNNVLQEIPEHLVHAVVRFCDGLPLLVLVLGGYLSSIKQEYIWEGVLRKLERAESIGDDQEKLIGKLRLSFLGLNETEKMIFLDLTLFDGLYDLELLIPAWESILSRGVVEINLEQLMRKSLLICDHDVRCWFQRPEKRFDAKDLSRVKVHRQLREMGWSLLRPASETAVELCKGIWQLQDVEKLLTQKARKSEVEVISLERSDTLTNHRRLQVNWDRIGRLGKLRFLQLKNVNFVGCCNLRFPFDLCLLHLINCSRESESVNKRWPWEWVVMESTSCWPLREQDRQGLKKLAVLLLEHCRSVRLPTNFHHLENLKVLRIQAKDVTHLPPLFGHLPSLQSLFLNCPNLQQLPPSFLHLPELRELKLMGCSALNSLPVFFLLDGFSSNSPRLAFAPLANLTDLCIVRASSLTELPDSFGQLKSLQRLVIDECRALKKLPEGFGDLQQLESLKIIWCKELRYLCQSFGHLDSLRELDIGECFNLQGLPHSFGHMKALRTLRIDSCNALSELPESLGQLQALTSFKLESCDQVQSLPESIEQLKSLERLSIVSCAKLESFSAPSELNVLYLRDLEMLKSLPDSISQMRELRDLYVFSCSRIRNLPKSMENIQTLESLHFANCPNLNLGTLKTVAQFTHLNSLSLCGCNISEECLASIRSLQPLRRLRLTYNQRQVPSYLQDLKSFKSLTIAVGQVESLDDSLGNLSSLRSQAIFECDNLKTLPERLGRLRILRNLTIESCPQLETLPNSVAQLRRLERLTIENCCQLKFLPESIGRLKKLTHFMIDSCAQLTGLPDSVGELRRLSYLKIRKCDNLKTLPATLAVEYLEIYGCISLEALPGSFAKQSQIYVRDCVRLTPAYLDSLPYSVCKR